MASNLFNKAPLEMPNKSGFDMSHENFFTAMCGTLTPCLVDYLLPNDTVSVGFNAQIQLPPMATDFYGEVVGKFELFFVPYRVLYGGWRFSVAPVDGSRSSIPLPCLYLDFHDEDNVGAGSLADYLGLMVGSSKSQGATGDRRFNIFPFLAYHKIWDDWYRDSRITKPCFVPLNDSSFILDVLPYLGYDSSTYDVEFKPSTANFSNGFNILDLHQRCWPKDYFTNATLMPEAGDPASLSFKVEDGEGSFTIAGLRAANSLQMFMERNNIAGNRYQDRIRAHYGVYPSDAVTDKALYLGSGLVNVYCKSIFQSSRSESSQNTENPFTTVGSKYGSSQGVGGGSLCKKFTATEHGVLMCLFSLVPRRYYSSGIRRQLWFSSTDDIPYPSLCGVGDQAIMTWELTGDQAVSNFEFGYTQRYAEYKFMNNEVHGLLRDGENLSAFCLQSNYFDIGSSYPTLSTNFVEIPTDYLDQVCAVAGNVSKFGCWNDVYFSYKKVSTLPAYSIPTLENMKFSHVENVPLGGTRL